jgi:hypothetical protein
VTKKYALDRSVYELVGVVEHKGRSSRMGHYFSYVKNDENWYLVIFPCKLKANDRRISEVEEDEVMSSKAYMLVYERVEVLTGDDIRSNITISSFGTYYPDQVEDEEEIMLAKRAPDKNNEGIIDSDLEDFDEGKFKSGKLKRTVSSIPGTKKRKNNEKTIQR